MNEKYEEIVKHYEETVVQLDDPEVIKTALTLAYYCAMLDAALADPMPNAAEQEGFVEVFQDKITELTETFQSLVNELV